MPSASRIETHIYLRVEAQAKQLGGVAFVNANAKLPQAVVSAAAVAIINLVICGVNAAHRFTGKMDRISSAMGNCFDAVAGDVCDQVAVTVHVNYVAGYGVVVQAELAIKQLPEIISLIT